MKVLHLFSDWKWTGPAEPVLSLCETLNHAGVDVTLAYRKTPMEFRERTVEKEAKKRDIKLYDGLRLNRYFSLKDWSFDIKALRSFVKREHISIVHTNLSHDHFTALLALSFSKERPLIVRTDHKWDAMPADRFTSWGISRTDGIVTYSEKIRRQDSKNFDYPQERTVVISPAIKPYTGPVTNIRPELGLLETDRVIGVIGRLKPERGFDIILKAFKKAHERVPDAKLVIMGRSSQIEESVIKPLKSLGLENDVVLAGYRVEDYFSVIAAFDFFTMMRAGSDGSARALREVMAMGKPAIVSDVGMLCEIVEDGRTGFVTGWDDNELAQRMVTLLTDDEKQRQFGVQAAKNALEKWDYRLQAEQLKEFYDRLLLLGKKKQ